MGREKGKAKSIGLRDPGISGEQKVVQFGTDGTQDIYGRGR